MIVASLAVCLLYLCCLACWKVVLLDAQTTTTTVLNTVSGRISSSVTAVTDQFQWRIEPNVPTTNIQFIFENLNIQQAELRLFDTSFVNLGITIWNCVICGVNIPPSFFSTTGSVTIVIKAIKGVSFTPSGFTLFYIATPRSFMSLPTSISINMNLGYNVLLPFAVDGQIPSGSTQRWVIRLTPGQRITFTFASFNMQDDCLDNVVVYDSIDTSGRLLFTGCKSSDIPQRWFYSQTGFALVLFTSRNATSTSSFRLNYYSNNALFGCGSFFSFEEYTGSSMILTDGSGPGLMRRGETCTWKVTPSQTGTVTLIMSEVSLKFGGSLIVYDSADNTGYVLWNGVGATLTVPPIIRSTGNSLFVFYRSDTADPVRFTGFFGEYYTNFEGSIGSGRGFSTLAMSSEIDIVPPGNGIVHTTGSNYTWFIQPSIVIGKLTFALSYMKLLDREDRVFLYDGIVKFGNETLLGSFSGTSLPDRWYITSGSAATLIFQTKRRDVNDTNGLFKMSYYSDGPNYHCGFTRNPASLRMLSWIITDGSQSIESLYSNQYCEWNIEPDSDDITGIYLFFTRYNIKGGSLTIYIGKVSENNVFTVITDSSAPPSAIFIPSKVVGISYSTSSAAIGYGFSLTYYAIQNSRSFTGNSLVHLASSTLPSLKLHPTKENLPMVVKDVLANTNLTWLIQPLSATGRLYLALTSLQLASCDLQQLHIYDGNSLLAPLLATYCSSSNLQNYKWIVSSAAQVMLSFKSHPTLASEGNFDIAYFADGANYHCGFHNNPQVYRTPSMVISDGSASTERMNANQLCEWYIEPDLSIVSTSQTDDDKTSSRLIVIEFLRCDLLGGSIQIYEVVEDNNSSSSSEEVLLWSCEDCQYLPKPLITTSKKLHVVFQTRSATDFGTGFTLVYWIANTTDWRDLTPESTLTASSSTSSSSNIVSTLLEVPEKFSFDSVINSNAARYLLAVDNHPSTLAFYPQYDTHTTSHQVPHEDIIDGRPSSTFTFESSENVVGSCGILSQNKLIQGDSQGRGKRRHILQDSTFIYTATQSASHYLMSRIDSKTLSHVEGIPTTARKSNNNLIQPMEVCKYYLDSGSTQAIRVTITSTSFQEMGRLRIYGGVFGNDSVVYDSNLQPSFLGNVTIPCGRSLIVLERNATNQTSVYDDNSYYVNYGFSFDYVKVTGDTNGLICMTYIQSLLPPVKKEDPYIPYYIAAGGSAVLITAVVVMIILNKRKLKQGYYFYPEDTSNNRKYTVVTPNHPKYNGRWDAFLNKFLRHGQCCVCQTAHITVFTLKCNHKICLDDTKGYLESALGDISMFPVKCPMHYEGCTGNIDSRIAKRILSEVQYQKFLEFSDRSIYGDGMRCIFCNNYVNFPDQMHRMARVECPYCIQRFCIRCRKPWHVNNKCPLDTYDDSVEVWKEETGAQQCPCCKKLIEKDDPDTCNHMVHKLTDGIPCLRERTDFCYLCGEEVTPDYPHEEVRKPGINHFPDGVFQKCRVIIAREKEAERERLRKLKRMKNKSATPSPLMSPNGSTKKSSILPAEGLDWDESMHTEIAIPIASPVVARSQPSPATSPSRIVVAGVLENMDTFDEEWDLALAQVDAMTSPNLARRNNSTNAITNHNNSYANLRNTLGINSNNNLNNSPGPSNPLVLPATVSSLQQRYQATSLQNSMSSVQAVNSSAPNSNTTTNAPGLPPRSNTLHHVASTGHMQIGSNSRQGSPQRFVRHTSHNTFNNVNTSSSTR